MPPQNDGFAEHALSNGGTVVTLIRCGAAWPPFIARENADGKKAVPSRRTLSYPPRGRNLLHAAGYTANSRMECGPLELASFQNCVPPAWLAVTTVSFQRFEAGHQQNGQTEGSTRRESCTTWVPTGACRRDKICALSTLPMSCSGAAMAGSECAHLDLQARGLVLARIKDVKGL
ncbi:hypothetical protein BDV95DRAFT_611429 [Massariosphaeria phaeospora]|uniref:Uncharacterized protein n=1 Tax=Massariosphaeria phaeospora TaxID=100035 RepID=A0A7C8I303_9PLEO|nr:hypothetical protein BDV95DRAFT_611429 [Massariosphaeria phaeospora]